MKSQMNWMRFALCGIGLFLFQSLSAQVVINEFMFTNLCNNINPNQIQDNFGNCEDWVELYNTTGAPVDLSGHYLTDRITNLNKWSFPAGSIIPANGFLRVWLSARVNVPFNLANLHANFRVGQTQPNEIIALVAPDGSTILDIDMIDVTSQVGHTRGRFPDGADNWVIFTQPTIGASNNGATPYLDYAPTPVFNQPAGYHGGAINVAISIPDPNPGFTIRYTLDGTFPTAASPVYTGPINISATTVLMAATFSADPNYLRSFYEFSTFFFGTDQHTIPAFSVAGGQVQTLLQGTQIAPLTTLEMFDENGQRISKNVGDTNKHGNDSWAYQQRGIDWIDRDKMGYTGATELQLFRTSERTSYKRYMFKAAANDNYDYAPGNPAHIRDAYVMSLSQVGNLELDERSVEFCVLYCNGQYWGVYDYREKVDDWHFTLEYYNQDKHQLDFLKTWGGSWAKYGNFTNWNNLRNFITGNDMTDQTNYDYVKTQLNVISLIDYFAINTWIVASDWLNWNTAWWRGYNEFGDAQKWRYTLWDMDASFGHYINYTGIPNTGPYADPCFGEQLNNPGGQGHTQIMSALLDNEEFFNTYINRYADLINTVFSCDFAIAHLDSLIDIIDPEMPRQIERWNGTYNGWQNGVTILRNFIETRCAETIIEGMEDCYDLTAIEVTIMIEGEGEVVLNGITITPGMTPWTGTYFAEVPFDLTAIETGEGVFQFWETLVGNLEYDDETTFSITVNPDGSVTIVAHFIPVAEFPVTFIVEPEGTGQIELNGDLLPFYPFTDSLTAGPTHNLVAIAEPGWAFSHWESTAHGPIAFSPNDTTEAVGYILEQTDQVIAHFYQLPVELIITVDEIGMGEVILNGTALPGYPHIEMIVPGNIITLEAVPNPGYEFVGWTFQNHTVTNLEDLLVNFELIMSDEIVAVFQIITTFNVVIMTEPQAFGTVELDGANIGSYWEGMLSTLESYALRANSSGPFYEFVGWQSTNGGVFTPNADLKNVTLNIFNEDTIIAMFVELPNYEIIVRVEPEGTGRVMMNWSVLPYLPWTGQVLGMDNTGFIALPNNEWQFSHWTTNYHVPAPASDTEEIRINFNGPDEIVAHFVPREFHFYMPNSFSPNGDGINDIFRPVGNEWHPQHFLMQIFNRQGNLVFETNNAEKGWDGSEAGQTHYAQVQVYVYRVEVRNAINGKNETFTGHVTVLR
jgi:gliding motility-associated-like protein